MHKANQSDLNLQSEGYSFQQQHLCTESFIQEPHKVHPGEVQIPAPGEEIPWKLVHLVGHPDEKQLGGERPGESSVCACG